MGRRKLDCFAVAQFEPQEFAPNMLHGHENETSVACFFPWGGADGGDRRPPRSADLIQLDPRFPVLEPMFRKP